MVHIVGAVEDDALFGQGLCKIFCRLSFSCTCRTSRSTTKIKLKCTHKSHIALISQRCNNKTTSVSEVLITIGENSGNTLTPALVLLLIIFVPVVTKLGYPFELVFILYVTVN
jgi:hypothetical protein